ncbi:MAG: EamA/RhaT family transporter, partial [Deltaproteobacteria bacterium]|nr:EamA/RhaT family transporter [Deltaproteobacteria bacterium]
MNPSRASEGKNRRIQGYVQVASGGALISFSAVFVKLAHVGPATAGFYRMLFGGLILLLLLGLRREPVFRGHGLSPLVAVCGLLFSLDLTFWHRSIQAVGPGLST